MRLAQCIGLVSLLIGLCFISVFSGAPVSGSQQEKATLIKEGVLTRRQREHSKLFKAYGSGQKLTDLVRQEGEIEIRNAAPLSGGVPDSPIATRSDALKHDVCIADAIITGTVKEKSSQLTENEEFIFTDYQLTVGDVVKQNTSSTILIGSDITVTGPGGRILLQGKRIRAIDSVLPPLKVGQRYLIFLKYIPTTDSYREIESGATFRVDGHGITKDSEASFHGLEVNSDVMSFLSEVKIAAAGACERGGVK